MLAVSLVETKLLNLERGCLTRQFKALAASRQVLLAMMTKVFTTPLPRGRLSAIESRFEAGKSSQDCSSLSFSVS